jgi:glycosyltransferase involved in cell wall biosynthesis
MRCFAPRPGEAVPHAGRSFPQIGAPLISIVIPAFDRPHLLAQALSSIVEQTVAVPLEVIVCDDGGLGETRAVAQRLGGPHCRYLRNPRPLGAVGNWNRCLKEAAGKWVMILHEDDALYPWYFECVVPRLEGAAGAVCMRTSRGAVVPAARRPKGTPASLQYEPRLFLKSSMTPFPGVLMRRDLAIRLGGFDERWGPIADYEFWYRLACAGRVEVVRATGAFYRVAPGQWTERTWCRMLRLSHLLRLRIAREQFPASPRVGRALARFFTLGNARCYLSRFGAGPADLVRCISFRRCLFSRVPRGWVWRALRFASRPWDSHPWVEPDARAPQIQQAR